MMPTYESKLAVDLAEWSFQVELRSPEGMTKRFASKIPDHGILSQYAAGRKMLHVTVGRDNVELPKELFATLLGEITNCQNLLRNSHGRSRPRSAYQ